MNRYVLSFTKQGNMKYISHLDLHRLFKRSLRKVGVRVDYSKGYNPHEMINVVQPLSLGFESLCEYFEMETPENLNKEEFLNQMNNFLPEGIRFTGIKKIQKEKQNLAAKCRYAAYHISFPARLDIVSFNKMNYYLNQDEIFIEKKDKKTGLFKEKEIKALIKDFYAMTSGDEGYIDCILSCATNESLNPLLLAKSFCKYIGISPLDSEFKITRKELFSENEKSLVSLMELYEEV